MRVLAMLFCCSWITDLSLAGSHWSVCLVYSPKKEPSDPEPEFMPAGCSRKGNAKVPSLDNGSPSPYEIELGCDLQEGGSGKLEYGRFLQ